MGAACVRDCERTAHEMHAPSDTRREQSPGLASMLTAPGEITVGRAFTLPAAAVSGKGTGDQNTPRFNDQKDKPREESRGPGSSSKISPRSQEGDVKEPTSEVCYEGTLLGSSKHGVGLLRMDGCTYEGDFRNDLKHGVGVLTWDDGRQYHGQFQFGKFHGNAIMTWPDGRRYCGQYVEDRKQGEGTFSWQDGRRYQGQWVTGKRDGIGVYTNAKGITRTGLWQMDRPLSWEAQQTGTDVTRD
uniref:MORN repeat-containing protein 5 n=1 Tax=Noctiluca scintillans TaxID=2966 RepID=A0A7S1AMF6_NOCSC